jgi:DNA mismatch endonuclease, patch repair protein
MADVFTPAQRRRVMRAVLSRDTQPELLVRRLAARLGFRMRATSRTLPGSPDLVYMKMRKAIFVHGCFWHRHACPRGRSHPADRRAFWAKKFAGNVRRDRAALRALRNEGWRTLVIWECGLKPNRLERTIERLRDFLND